MYLVIPTLICILFCTAIHQFILLRFFILVTILFVVIVSYPWANVVGPVASTLGSS